MIQLLATKYQKRIAFLLFFLFDLSFMFSSLRATAGASPGSGIPRLSGSSERPHIPDGRNAIAGKTRFGKPAGPEKGTGPFVIGRPVVSGLPGAGTIVGASKATAKKSAFIGGPSQPEMSSFKSIGTDNMVNLFTGDFSYNIPLLDVGGYPVNIYYDGGVGMEQEASWVGLGWNINPGNINRNTRGIPDDFDGTDTLLQWQNMKPNKTWGTSLTTDLEIIGLKQLPVTPTLGFTTGISFNNYLGPALEMGLKEGITFNIGDKVIGEKSASDPSTLKVGASVSENLSSRDGLTISPSVSLTASAFSTNSTTSLGVGLSTSYNSRSGVKALQLSEQASFNTNQNSFGERLLDQFLGHLHSSTISFAKPSYIPAIRMPLTNSALSGRFQLGGAIYGFYVSQQTQVYLQSSQVSHDKILQKKPMVGYLYYQNALNNPNAVMDFTRFNDREVTPNTPIISAPQYSYDVFSIQGEGTGGSIRAYRDDLGTVRDNTTGSQDESQGLGADIGIPGHYGGNYNIVKTPSQITEWGSGNKLHASIPFKAPTTGIPEKVYFRNPGESSVLDPAQFNRIGGVDLVRYQLGGDSYNPTVEPVLSRFAKDGTPKASINVVNTSYPAVRKKRTQVIDFLTAGDAMSFGLDKWIKSYDNQTLLDSYNKLKYDSFSRVSGYRKANHISQINVTESNGKRYIYGIPVYNTLQKDFTFSVSKTAIANADDDKIQYVASDTSATDNIAIQGGVGSADGFVQVTQTPAYAHSFLLSGLLSPDYVDVTGDGITEDDLGDAVKFNYTEIQNPDRSPLIHKWRTPLDASKANFNSGKRSETKDDKGVMSYGERESWYMHSIESKTMIAFFILENRKDGRSVSGDGGGINTADTSLKRLKEIRLYSKADLATNGLANAKPIKTVNFVYSYRLCHGTPDNPESGGTNLDSTGKLCLDQIYFTFNGQYNKVNKNRYVFNYGDSAANPDYVFNGSDRWGNYKPEWMNPVTQTLLTGSGSANLKNSYYPYPIQDPAKKDSIDTHAAAWALKKILLPSGGQLEVNYESDDYAYVQNLHATDMMSVVGFGNSPTTISNRLYNLGGNGATENDYLFIHVPVACHNAADVYQKYLQGLTQISVKLAVTMPKGVEHFTSYATIDSSTSAGYGVTADTNTVWLKLHEINGIGPLSLTAIEYLREQLPGQAFEGYDVSESSGLPEIALLLMSMLKDLKEAFTDPVTAMRDDHKAINVVLDQSFARLNDPDGFKYGGGHRVKSIRLKDNWKAMTQQYNTCYEQDYDYTKTEVFNGVTRTISSGVASYEPSIGGDENPFQNILLVADKLPLGPTSYGSIEMPMLDAFFPAPGVGYSQVTVRSVPSVKANADSGQKSQSVIGRQVTEFYTAKDYPVYYSNTPLDPMTDLQAHNSSSTDFFYSSAFDSRALSQGFLIEVNDMHGKMKTQSSYAANDTTLRVNYTENFYRNTGSLGLNEKFNFVSAAQGGLIDSGNIGIDVELMTDTREFTVSSHSLDVQGQADLFEVIYPFWLPTIWPVVSNSDNNYRAVTTTKVVNYHSILDSVAVHDKGSVVSTKNMVYEGETGEVIVNRTNNEFNQSLYSTSYPAWWAYSGMGPAYKNTGMIFTGVNFYDGRIMNSGFDFSPFESGDEIRIDSYGNGLDCVATLASGDVGQIWVLDTNKNSSSLTDVSPNYIFIDRGGHPYTNASVNFHIIRSGKRNMLDQKAAGITSMSNPVAIVGGVTKLLLDSTRQVINASAVEYREKWQIDRDEIETLKQVFDTSTCTFNEVLDCNGYLEKHINPYVKGLLGNFRNNRSLVFYGNRVETDINALSKNGLLYNFNPYWNFNVSNNLVPNLANANWVWKDEIMRVNAKGMELETRNALNIYTAAQYGYNKTLPTAIVNNARYDEMAYDGFEDKNYNNYIDNESVFYCSNQQHLDLSSMANTRLINTDTMAFNAHTGKYVLGVNSGNTAAISFPIIDGDITNYNLQYTTYTKPVLMNIGANLTTFPVAPDPTTYHIAPTISNNSDLHLSAEMSLETARDTSSFNFSWNGYIKIPAKGNYTFENRFASNFRDEDVALYSNTVDISLVDSNGTAYSLKEASLNYNPNDLVPPPSTYVIQPQDVGTNTTLNLCPGIYRVIASGFFTVFARTGSTLGNIPMQYYFDCIGLPPYVYINTDGGCTSTIPIAATASMLNPSFSMQADQKMVFSAWVHEDSCGVAKTGGVCNQSTFSHNHVVIGDGITSTSIYPVGPILDGWQRYEGYFTASASATTGSIQFVNSSGNMTYFDDVRIFPFNADMKSYVYDPVSLRLVAELDANNYASFYEYDEEGTLVRTKAETIQGIKTIKETRSSKQKNITAVQ